MLNKIDSYIESAEFNQDFHHKKFFFFASYVYVLGTIIHILLLLFFNIISIPELAFYNILSILSFISAFLLNWKGKYSSAFVVMLLEIIIHSTLTVYYLGWEANFHLFIFLLTPIVYLNSRWNNKLKISLVTLIILYYSGIFFLHQWYPPKYIINQNLLNYIGLFSSCITLATFSYLAYYFSLAVQKADKIIAQKNNELEQKNDTIISSITYARTIQYALLPDKVIVSNKFSNFFAFYKAKDIVSGDFYWIKTHLENEVLAAVVDCTGHGVPGAMLAMIGKTLLSQIVNEKKINDPAEILTNLEIRVREVLKQDVEGSFINDGMDIALCKINLETKECIISSAKRPTFVIKKDGTQIKIDAIKKSIGGKRTFRNEINFSNFSLQLESEDWLFLFTDGFTDQNNKSGKKLGANGLLDLIKEIRTNNISNAEEFLESKITEFSEGEEQRDDLTLLGFKIK